MNPKTVECYFDVGSPAAYLAWTQLPHLAADTGTRIDWKPMLLGGVFQATGNHSPATVRPKGRYMGEDLARFARRYGVPFRFNSSFPINTLMLMRGASGLQRHEPERLPDYLRAVFEAIWVQDRDMNDPGVVAEVLGDAGFDPAAFQALVADPDVKALLKTQTEEAVARGVFGAPTMFVDGTMYWGQDRLDFVREALA